MGSSTKHVSVAALLMIIWTSGNAIELQCGKDTDCGGLTDDDPAVSRFVKCGACQLSVRELAFEVIRTEERTKSSKVKSSLAEPKHTGLLENYCVANISNYGLQLDTKGAPIPKFTADVSVNRASGGWIRRRLQAVCEEVVDDYASELGAAMNFCVVEGKLMNCNPEKLVRRVCFTELKYCEYITGDISGISSSAGDVNSPGVSEGKAHNQATSQACSPTSTGAAAPPKEGGVMNQVIA